MTPIKSTELEIALLKALDEIDRINREDDASSIATAANLCAQECIVWSTKLSIALRTGNDKAAQVAHRAHMESEQRRLAAENKRKFDMVPILIERLDAQDKQADALGAVDEGIPDFLESDE